MRMNKYSVVLHSQCRNRLKFEIQIGPITEMNFAHGKELLFSINFSISVCCLIEGLIKLSFLF